MLAVIAVGVLVAGALGYVIGKRSVEPAPVEKPVVLAEPVSKSGLTLSVPVGWNVDEQRVSSGSILSGLSILAARPDTPQAARLIGWLSTGDVNPQLLPLGRIDPASLQEAPAPATVEFPDGQTALRYDGLRLRGRKSSLRVYVAPTTQGVMTLACPTEYLPQPCDAVATTLTADGGTPLTIDPDGTVAGRLRVTLSRLGEAITEPLGVMAKTNQGAKVASASADLESAYRAASDSVKAIVAPLGAATVSFTGVAARLNDVASAYSAINTAATRADRRAYDQGRKRLADAREQLRLTLGSLRRQGYDVKVTS